MVKNKDEIEIDESVYNDEVKIEDKNKSEIGIDESIYDNKVKIEDKKYFLEPEDKAKKKKSFHRRRKEEWKKRKSSRHFVVTITEKAEENKKRGEILQKFQNWSTKHPENHTNNTISVYINPAKCRQSYQSKWLQTKCHQDGLQGCPAQSQAD